jgi:hypothetical protein
MTKDQIDQFDMALAVENHFNDNSSVWTANVPLAAAKLVLSSKIIGVAEQLAIQLINTTGVTIAKDTARKKLEDQAYLISKALSGYASVINNSDLFKRCNYTKTNLSDFRGAELIGVCTNLAADATTEISNLSTYSVLPATVTTLSASISNFSAVIKNPEEAIARRKAATDKIAILLPDLMDMLNNRLDNLIVALASTQSAFVEIYDNVRSINNSPTNSWSLTTTCMNSINNVAISGVELSIVGENIHRTSQASGFNTFQNLVEGHHQIVATHPNFKTKTIDFVVVSGETTDLLIAMLPI